MVIRRGNFGYQYYYIYSGNVHVTYASDDQNLYSKGVSVRRLGKGDSFGVRNKWQQPQLTQQLMLCLVQRLSSCCWVGNHCLNLSGSGLGREYLTGSQKRG